MGNYINLVKLSVGTESIDDMLQWQRLRSKQVTDGQYYHVTRMWPKREGELLNGGSIYWVIKGVILCRQEILGLKEVYRDDGIRRCGLCLAPEIIRVNATPKKAFQGWRYFAPADAPGDMAEGREHEEALPPELSKALSEIGLL